MSEQQFKEFKRQIFSVCLWLAGVIVALVGHAGTLIYTWSSDRAMLHDTHERVAKIEPEHIVMWATFQKHEQKEIYGDKK